VGDNRFFSPVLVLTLENPKPDHSIPIHSVSDGGGGFVTIGGSTGNVGGVVGWGIILMDFLPHCIFGGNIGCSIREPE